MRAQFQVLGVGVQRSKGLAAAPDNLNSAAVEAMCGMMRRVKGRELMHIGLRLRLFSSGVMPVLQYGCEAWSAPSLRDPSQPAAGGSDPALTSGGGEVDPEECWY